MYYCALINIVLIVNLKSHLIVYKELIRTTSYLTLLNCLSEYNMISCNIIKLLTKNILRHRYAYLLILGNHAN